MPIMGGIEATELILEHAGKHKGEIKVIGLTGDSDLDMKTQCQEAGMNEVCKKISDLII